MRIFVRGALAAVLVTASAAVHAENPPPPPPPGGPPPGPGARDERGEVRDPRIDQLPPHMRKRVADMKPEDRDKFLANLERWQRMSEAERSQVRDAGRQDLGRARAEIERLADDLGLKEGSEDFQRFVARYREERRRVEEKVREEAQKIRRPLVEAMHQDLRKEFARPKPTPEAPAGE